MFRESVKAVRSYLDLKVENNIQIEESLEEIRAGLAV